MEGHDFAAAAHAQDITSSPRALAAGLIDRWTIDFRNSSLIAEHIRSGLLFHIYRACGEGDFDAIFIKGVVD